MTMQPYSSTAPIDRAPSVMTWFLQRRAILTTIGVGAVTWPAMIGITWLLLPASWTAAPEDRVARALQLLAAPALLLLLMIAACLRLFDEAGAENPFAGVESQRFKINQRVITNTIEQGAVFVPLVLALATRVSDEHWKLLPVAVVVWCAGRLLFWVGYHVAPRWRAPGFDWTFLTTSLLAGWFVYTLF